MVGTSGRGVGGTGGVKVVKKLSRAPPRPSPPHDACQDHGSCSAQGARGGEARRSGERTAIRSLGSWAHWVPRGCQTLSQVPGAQQETKQTLARELMF